MRNVTYSITSSSPLAGTHPLTSRKITKTLRDAVTILYNNLGFLASDVSARSLRAAGSNALLFVKVNTDTIQLIGRWKSKEMLQYLHVQAAPLMADYSMHILNAGTYLHILNQLVPMY